MAKKSALFFLLILFVCFGASCSSFILDTQQPVLKELENGVYVLAEDTSMGDTQLTKGQEVRLLVNGGDDWVKVYAYPAQEDKLKASRVLILYLFPEDFKDEIFDMEVFKEKLLARAALKTEPDVKDVKEQKQKPKQPAVKKTK